MKIFLITVNVLIAALFLMLTFVYVIYADISTDAIEKLIGVDGIAIGLKNIALFLIAYGSGSIVSSSVTGSMRFYRRFNKKESMEF